MKKEQYLIDFQSLADSITKKYIDQYKKSNLKPDEYINSIADNFKRELAEKGTDIFHQSIIKGVDDNLGLITGVQKINFESVMKLKTKILK